MNKCNKCGLEYTEIKVSRDFRVLNDYKGFMCCCGGFVTVSDPGGTRGNWTWKQMQVGL